MRLESWSSHQESRSPFSSGSRKGFRTHLPWPNVESLVYLGENVTGEDPGKLVFQDTGSYCELGPYPNNASGDIYLVTTERDTLPPNLFDLNGVLDQLNRYAAKQARAAAKRKR